MPRVSIGLPVYNGENFIREAIEGILAQSFQDWELIISDNASTDATPEICQACVKADRRIHYHRQEKNLGAIPNYNFVFEKSSGEYFKWSAHDDLIGPAFLDHCVEALDRNPEVVLSFPEIGYADENGKLLRRVQGDLSIRASNPGERMAAFVKMQAQSTDLFWTIFGLIRADALRATGLFDTFVASDRVLLMRLLLRGQFQQVEGSYYYRREHPKASTINLPRLRKYRAAAKWYDAQSQQRIVMPNWRLLAEYSAAIKDARLNWQAKAQCHYWLACLSALRWKKLLLEISSIPGQIFGTR